jgi:hypothetical protein
MPARSERLFICPAENGQPGWVTRFPIWWDSGAFIEKHRHREIDLGNPIDANYVWLLTSAEAIAWNKEHTERFSSDPQSGNPLVVEEMRRLESALARASWVVVESYEWESGLD